MTTEPASDETDLTEQQLTDAWAAGSVVAVATVPPDPRRKERDAVDATDWSEHGLRRTTDPTIEEDLAELEAYFHQGPAVSRAACGRMVTTYRLLATKALAVADVTDGLRQDVDNLHELNDALHGHERQLRWEISFLCDRILELRAFDADEDARITEAANQRLREERAEIDQLNGRLLALINGAVIALKGPHPPHGLHDLSDVAAVATALRNRYDGLVTTIKNARSPRQVPVEDPGGSELLNFRTEPS